MTDPDYSPADITIDAVKFSRSRYGKHYKKTLEESVKLNTARAIDLRLTPQENRDAAVRADQDTINLQYFETAESIASSPSLMKKLRDGFNKRIKKGDTKTV